MASALHPIGCHPPYRATTAHSGARPTNQKFFNLPDRGTSARSGAHNSEILQVIRPVRRITLPLSLCTRARSGAIFLRTIGQTSFSRFTSKKAGDEERDKETEAKSRLENYVYKMKDTLKGIAKRINIKDKRKLGNAIEQTTQWLEWNVLLVESSKFEEKLQELKSICEPLIAKMQLLENACMKTIRVLPKIEMVKLD